MFLLVRQEVLNMDGVNFKLPCLYACLDVDTQHTYQCMELIMFRRMYAWQSISLFYQLARKIIIYPSQGKQKYSIKKNALLQAQTKIKIKKDISSPPSRNRAGDLSVTIIHYSRPPYPTRPSGVEEIFCPYIFELLSFAIHLNA